MKPENTLLPEWAPQSAVMLTWPHDKTDWVDNLSDIESVYLQMVKEITAHEQVLIVCYSENHQQHICQRLAENLQQRCVFVIAESNDSWCRDHGPITVTHNQQPLLLDFQFNGWGNKFAAQLDNAINQTSHRQNIFTCSMESIPLILEGGSIDTDGCGSLLTTERCLLSDTRNPGYSREQLENELRQLLGIKQFLWLQHGALAGDDTDSHIDTLARFCNEDTIVYCQCDDRNDEHYDELQRMYQELTRFTTPHGKPYKLVPLPLPAAIYDADDGHRLPATYANFLIINDAVLVPVYNDKNDQLALQTLADIFSDRTIIAINCLPVIKQHGSLHCLTMQLPEGVLATC